jgi:MYXO-CTERM domain-containing protein
VNPDGGTGADGGTGTDGGATASSSSGLFGTGGAGTGGSGAGGTGTGTGTGASGLTGTPHQNGGCGCKTAGDPAPSSEGSFAAFGMLALAGALRSRKRRG